MSFLSALGLTDAGEAPLLALTVENVLHRIQNETGAQPPFPAGLENIADSMAAGEYLRTRKAAGQLTLEGVDLDAAVKQLQEGDTSVTFAAGEGSQTPEQRLDGLIDALLGRARELSRYRRLVW
ncbi:MAG: hypothetical protein H9864_08105 [Candidatus Faecalibacterium intestinavium]|uniref:Uncharacterized protein n=1 Tax=Candidatus Faecalibacterium intestinavium TaxID=2838580 RepID=A0A9E2KLM7_9FIRM|nr:hypothetical protein [Candidatus Faecalibacterium intestinavium]